MDHRTLSFYETNASEVAAKQLAIANGASPFFDEAFPEPGSRILDIGSGSGRDMLHLMGLGYDAHGLEPSRSMLEESVRRHPKLNRRIHNAVLPLPRHEEPHNPYVGILCSASLMHIPVGQLPDAALDIKRLLKPGGRLLITVPDLRPGLDEHRRDEYGRLFTALPAGVVLLLFEPLGFKEVRRWNTDDSMGRAGFRWNTVLFDWEHGDPLPGSATHPEPLDTEP